MAKKPIKRAERVEVVYNTKRWKLLSALREKALEIMEALETAHLFSIVHGSIARGDVDAKSDIDVFVPDAPNSFLIENALERTGYGINTRLIVQATPTYAAKGYIELAPQCAISFSLMKLRRTEREFYRFGGEATLETLGQNARVAGVDKRLMLIEPTSEGHVETSIVGMEEAIAKRLGVSIETVLDRVHALVRRDQVGRTGVFVKRELTSNETFEMVLKQLAEQNPAVHRRLKLFGK